MSCKIQKIHLTPPEPSIVSDMKVVDFFDGHWTLRFGDYGCKFEVNASTEDIAKLTSVLSAMLIENEQEMAAISGDYEYESKMDVLNTEAWLEA